MYTIGITARYDLDKKNIILRETYRKWLKKDFRIKLIIPNDQREYNDILNTCDLLIINGGDDINPTHYHEKNYHSLLEDPIIEQLDLDLIDLFYKAHKPIIGICRGIQIINVYFKGSLIQEIKNYNTMIDHQKNQHHLVINKNTVLGKYFKENIVVNSFHHQCIKEIAPKFNISAISEDGFIEAIEKDNIIGVQWHPELMDDIHKTLFIKMIKALLINHYDKNSQLLQ